MTKRTCDLDPNRVLKGTVKDRGTSIRYRGILLANFARGAGSRDANAALSSYLDVGGPATKYNTPANT